MLIFIPHSVPSSKNSRVRTRSGHFVVSKATKNWRKNTLEYWSSLRKNFVESCNGVESPLLIGLHFIRKTRHTYDFANPVQTIQDEMVKNKWILDDNVDIMYPVPLMVNGKYSTYDPDNEGVLIKVYRHPSEIELNHKYEFRKT